MELFRNPNIQFLKYKWYFLALSLVFSVAGVLSMIFWHGIPLGVDFRGGTIVTIKFAQAPNDKEIRTALDKVGLRDPKIQPSTNNVVLISLEQKETNESSLDTGKNQIIKALETNAPEGKQDLNNTGKPSLSEYLLQKDPLHLGTDAPQQYLAVAQNIVAARDGREDQGGHGGVLTSLAQLNGLVAPAVVSQLEQDYFLSNFGVRNVDIVGPQVGKQLQNQAWLAIGYSVAGMLIYLWFRFELIYGVAAVVACVHDTLITVGAFSLTNKEISLTVIAAILTLVGYSMNDTIVVFDRIRENVKLWRRESLASIVDKSINQTLSRTVLTSGLTFLTVLALYLFGGEVLHGFSFALVIGILIGTYSSIFIASPMLVAYQDWRGEKQRASAVAESPRKEKVRAKV